MTYAVCVEPGVDEATAAHFWSLYRASFEPLRTRAAARHIFSREEFYESLHDPAVLKYIGRDQDGVVQGLGTMSTDLSALPWISPDYFAARFPDQYASQKIYYVGIVLVHPEHQGGELFPLTMRTMLGRAQQEGAIGAFDVCRFNDEVVGLPRKLQAAVDGVAGRVQVLDVQTYYSVTFDAPQAEAAASQPTDRPWPLRGRR